MYEMLNYLNLMNIAITAHEKLKNNTTILRVMKLKRFMRTKRISISKSLLKDLLDL